MRSIIPANGDLITQSDLEAINEAEATATRLAHALAVRIAAGARVEPGALDIEANMILPIPGESWEGVDRESWEEVVSDMTFSWTGCWGEWSIRTAAEVARNNRRLIRHMVKHNREQAAKAVVPINTARTTVQ
jgi:hypothetical protein